MAKPMPPKPSNIIAHVAGSGTAAAELTLLDWKNEFVLAVVKLKAPLLPLPVSGLNVSDRVKSLVVPRRLLIPPLARPPTEAHRSAN